MKSSVSAEVNLRSSEEVIPLYKVHLPPREVLMPVLEETLYSGQITEGEEVILFEEEFARGFSLPLARSFSSATAALHTALILSGVKPGDEVISTPLTVEPTNMAILQAGGKIVWSDVDPRNGNILPGSVEKKITERTRAIMAVHYGGVPVKLDELTGISHRADIPLIEDAAHALGANYDGKPIGAHGNYVAFSFQAIKHLTTIDGGMLVLRSETEDERARRIRWFGMDRTQPRTDQRITETGYKYHMTNVPASIGRIQLKYIDAVLRAHRDNGRFFDRNLRGIDGVELCEWENHSDPAYWFYTLKVLRRAEFMDSLRSHGIECGTGSIRNDLHPAFGRSAEPLAGVDAFSSTMVHIPCGWWVGEVERDRILNAIREGW